MVGLCLGLKESRWKPPRRSPCWSILPTWKTRARANRGTICGSSCWSSVRGAERRGRLVGGGAVGPGQAAMAAAILAVRERGGLARRVRAGVRAAGQGNSAENFAILRRIDLEHQLFRDNKVVDNSNATFGMPSGRNRLTSLSMTWMPPQRKKHQALDSSSRAKSSRSLPRCRIRRSKLA